MIMSHRVAISSIFSIIFILFLDRALALEKNGTLQLREVDRASQVKNQSMSAAGVKTKKSSKAMGKEVDVQAQRKWVTQMFMEAQNKFDMDANVGAACKRDFEIYKSHLQNQSVWAVRMLESSQWPSVGIFSGMMDHMGNYDECLMVSTHGINGQYCLAEAIYDYEADDTSARYISFVLDYPDESKSAWSAMKMFLENPVRTNRHKLKWALCIPASCKAYDLKLSLNVLLTPIFHKQTMNISVDVNPSLCNKKEKPIYTKGYYITSVIYGVIFAMVISSTVYEIMMGKALKEIKKQSTIMGIFRSFSMKKNWKQLLKHNPETDLEGLHFVKIVNILFIVYGHRFIYFTGYPKFNSESVETTYNGTNIELVHTNVVDVFFMISGFLIFHFGFRPMMKGGFIYLFMSIIFRWIRMVPVFGLLMIFIINVLPFMYNAPLWNYRIMREVENCQTSWWGTLLAINNIVNTEKQCLLISWYISTDIQLTVVGSILLLLICRHRKLGVIVTVLTFMVGIGVTFAVAYINKFHGLLRLYTSLLEEPRKSYEFTNFYTATYNRTGPYLLGFIFAFIGYILREKNYIFSTKQMWLFMIVSIVIGEGSQYYGYLFYMFGREYDRFESATYAATSRTLFALPYAVAFCMYITSGLGKFGEYLQKRVFVSFGRLTYSVFLVNTIIQLIHASSQKAVMPTSVSANLYWFAITDMVLSYFFGFLLHLFAEAPLCNILKMMQHAIVKLFMKSHRDTEQVESAAASDVTSSDKSSANSSPEMNGQHSQNGYLNQSYVCNEIVPSVSESSRF